MQITRMLVTELLRAGLALQTSTENGKTQVRARRGANLAALLTFEDERVTYAEVTKADGTVQVFPFFLGRPYLREVDRVLAAVRALADQ